MQEKKKKPKISMTKTIKNFRERIKFLEEKYHRTWIRMSDHKDELFELRKLLPLKFYSIKYKIKANDEKIYDYEEIIKSYTPELAIDQLLKAKTYPNTFKLLDIKCLA